MLLSHNPLQTQEILTTQQINVYLTCRTVISQMEDLNATDLNKNMRGSQKVRFPMLFPPNNFTYRDASLFTYYTSLHLCFHMVTFSVETLV